MIIIHTYNFYVVYIKLIYNFLFIYRKVLEDHRISCESDGKYVEAEMAKNRVAELR